MSAFLLVEIKVKDEALYTKYMEQIPKYQGQYEEVKQSILKDAPRDAMFAHGFTDSGELLKVPREEW